MAKYLYNGKEYPAIPERDNTTSYAVICENLLLGVVTATFLYFLDTQLVRSDVNLTSKGVEVSGVRYTLDNDVGAWTEKTDTSGAFTLNCNAVWSNYDILNTDGTLYLAASEPVPILEVTIPRKVDRYSYIVGFNLALAGMAYPYSAPTPTAYLYNGIRLPALPEWDRGAYPYAYISNGFAGIGRSYVYFKNVEYGKTDGGNHCIIVPAGTGMSGLYSNDQWKEPTVTTEDKRMTVPNSALIWANFDVLNEDGTVYLAASDPVPVYE